MVTPQAIAHPSMTLAEAEGLMDRYRYHGLPVVDGDALVGILTITDILRVGGDLGSTPVTAAMTAKPVTVGPRTPVSEALERMAVLGVGRLPVVSDEDRTRLVGLFRREDAIRAYHQALGESTSDHLDRDRFKQRTEPDAQYYDFRIPAGSMADNRAVRDVRWPHGSTLVSVRRGTDVQVPRGDTVLHAGDVVTAFGTDVSKARMIERLNAGAEEPTAEIEVIQDGPQ
jgi:predicted transcriptional regulator